MEKLWEFSDSNFNRFILIKDQTIYIGTPTKKNMNSLNNEELKRYLFAIPYNKIEKIENQKGKKYIKVSYNRHSYKKLHLNEESSKSDIMSFLKDDLANYHYKVETPTNIEYATSHFLYFTGVLILYLTTLYYSIGISNGKTFGFNENGVRYGYLQLCHFLAKIGSLKVSILFISMLTLIYFFLRKKLKTKSSIETLKKNN